MSRYESIMNEPESGFSESCGHVGASPHVYTSGGTTASISNCPACHEQLSNQLAVIETVRHEHFSHAHAVAARACQLGLKPKTVLRILRALAVISNQDEAENEPFVMAWPHWCWDNFRPSTGTALAFPTEDSPRNMSEPGLGGSRRVTGKKASGEAS
jgi:hypothetical protein